mgnify:CR=1 FL=1
MKVRKSEYIKYSRFIVRKLHKSTCYGKGSMYEENVVAGLPDKGKAKEVLAALVKQKICLKKKKGHGWKYYLNMDRYDKIKEIIKENTNHEFDIVSNPEFLREGSAIRDFMVPDRIIIGYETDKAKQKIEKSLKCIKRALKSHLRWEKGIKN